MLLHDLIYFEYTFINKCFWLCLFLIRNLDMHYVYIFSKQLEIAKKLQKTVIITEP